MKLVLADVVSLRGGTVHRKVAVVTPVPSDNAHRRVLEGADVRFVHQPRSKTYRTDGPAAGVLERVEVVVVRPRLCRFEGDGRGLPDLALSDVGRCDQLYLER